MTTIGAHVNITGNSRDAVAAFDRARSASDRLNTGLGRMVGTVGIATVGVLGFGAATESARRLVQLGRESVAKYAESNTEAAERIEGSRLELEKFQVAVGNAIIGGDNLTEMTGAANAVLREFTATLNQNAGTMQSLALGAMQSLINGGIDLAQGFIRMTQLGVVLRAQVQSVGAVMAIAGAASDQLALKLAVGLNDAIASVTRGMANAAQSMLDFAGPALGDRAASLQAFVDRVDAAAGAQENYSNILRTEAAASAAEAAEAQARLNGIWTDAGDRLIQLDVLHGGLQRTQEAVNQGFADGSIAAQSYASSVGGANEAENEKLALGEKLIAQRERLKGIELAAAEKGQAEFLAASARIKQEAELEAYLAEIRQRAGEEEARRQESIGNARDAAIDGALGGFGRLASGNDKLTKALNAAAGARLAGQAIFQLNTGIGYALSGSYAAGLALIAQSVVSFTEAAKLGFGGGGKKGGARQSFTTVNQTVSFSGPVDASTAGGFADQLQAATRSGAAEGAR